VSTPVSLATLMQRVRQRANLEVGAATSAVSAFPDSEVIDAINVSIYEWWDMIRLTTFGGQYARVQFQITIVANQSLYPLPANCASIISVDAFLSGLGSSYPVNAQPYQEEQRNQFSQFPFSVGVFGPGNAWYQKQGENINFIPQPPSSYLFQVNYVPTAPQLQSPSGYLNSFNGWEEWIVCDAALTLLIKDGQTDIIPLIEARKAQQAERIRWAAAQADMNASEGVHEGQEPSNAGFGYGGGWC
jgi:hypothetical protein